MKYLTNWIDRNIANTTALEEEKNAPQQLYWQALAPIEALLFGHKQTIFSSLISDNEIFLTVELKSNRSLMSSAALT